MQVEFTRPVFLWLLACIPLFVYFFRRSKLYPLISRSLLWAVLVLAVSSPQLATIVDEQNVLFLVDRSASVSRSEQERASEFIREALASKPENDRAGTAVFGRTTAIEQPLSRTPDFAEFSVQPDSDYTDIERALRAGLSLLPSGNRRIVLLSDGQENLGSARDAAESLQEANVPVDVVPLEPLEGPDTMITHVQAPSQTAQESVFPVHVTVYSNHEAMGTLYLYGDDELVSEQDVDLSVGSNTFSFNYRPAEQGFLELRAEIDSPTDTILENNRMAAVVHVHGPHAILVVTTGSTPSPLAATLEAQGLAVTQRTVDQFPSELRQLQSYAAVVLDDVPARAFSSRQFRLIEDYVRDFGGGLLATGGLNSFAMGGYHESPFETILPVYSQLEEELLFPTLSLVLILDKSGSMRATEPGSGGLSRMDLAKQAAIGVVEMLLSQERIGILAFDTETEWVVPLQPAGDKQAIYDQLLPFDAGTGGTHIHPSLVEAFEALEPEESAVRHVILLSDGISAPGDWDAIMERYQEEEITLSSVSISTAADLELMDYLAQAGGGKHYFTADARSIPQILATEAERIQRSPLVDEPTQVIPLGDSVFATLADWSEVPELTGFTLTSPKERADVFLIAEDNSPLLAGWRLGLGRTMAFTSDTGGIWAQDWLGSPEHRDLWSAAVDWVASDADPSGIQGRFVYEEGRGEILVDAVDEAGRFRNFLSFTADVHPSNEDPFSVELEQTGPGRYEASVDLDHEGIYLANIRHDENGSEQVYPVAVAVPYSPEFGVQRTTDLLADLAEATDGRILENPEDVFELTQAPVREYRSVWPWFVLAALIIWVIDIGIRQLRGF